jgi:hypothetical protein
MSTFAYGALTRKRLQAKPGTSESDAPPGVGNYLDALAALVPAEVLSLHAVVLTFTTATSTDAQGQAVTAISAPGPLGFAFFVMLALTFVFFFLGLGTVPPLGWDYVRAAIPPLAFVAWTMLQKSTAFDAVLPKMDPPLRGVVAVLLAVTLAALAAALAKKADQKPV